MPAVFLTQSEVGSTANTYAILAKLATGGMAEIFLARTESAAGVERYVVLKRVLHHRATDIKFVHMFLDEARLAAQLQHPNIAQVYDTGKIGDSYFFTMEYVHGETVRELLHRAYSVNQPIPIGCALTIIAGAAAGLQHAHERLGFDGKSLGIVHRDVSPSNLMISYEGHIKVVDFGVAKATHRSIETQSGSVKGKIGYMSPEQCRGGEVDQRCDLFSLGIVMWELLVGERLFKRATDFESMEAIVTEASPAPSSLRPEIPKALDEIVLKLLAKAARDRYQSADELLEALEAAAMRESIAISVPGLRRFVRELFGQRPEPWVEMRIREANPEVVTVTGAPLVEKRDAAEPVDSQLGRLVDLSSPANPIAPALRTPSGPVAAPSPRAPTAPTVSGPIPRRTNPQPATTAVVGGSASTSGAWAPGVAASAADARVLPRRARWPLVIVALTLVGGGAIGATLWARSPKRPRQAAGATEGSEAATSPDRVALTPIAGHAVSDAAAPVGSAGEPPVVPAVAVPDDAEDVEASYRAARYREALAACTASPTVVAAHADTCTLAACRARDVDQARRWLQQLPATKRSAVARTCGELGAPLAMKVEPPRRTPPRHTPPKHTPPKPPPPKPPACDESDPMSCRR